MKIEDTQLYSPLDDSRVLELTPKNEEEREFLKMLLEKGYLCDHSSIQRRNGKTIITSASILIKKAPPSNPPV